MRWVVLVLGVGLASAACGARINETVRADAGVTQELGPVQVRVGGVTAASPKVPGYVTSMVKSFLGRELTSRGLSQARDRQVSLHVELTEYKTKSPSARFWFGALAGADTVQSVVELTDDRTETVLVRSTVQSANRFAIADVEMLARGHVQDIAAYVTGIVRPKR